MGITHAQGGHAGGNRSRGALRGHGGPLCSVFSLSLKHPELTALNAYRSLDRGLVPPKKGQYAIGYRTVPRTKLEAFYAGKHAIRY